MNILEALQHPDLFGDAFSGESWEPWRAVISGAFALPMEGERLELFKQLSGGREPPSERVRELWAIAGRRSAKTHTAAAIAVYLSTVGATLEGLTDRLSAGERGVIALLATDRAQAQVALRYIHGMFDASPALRAMIVKRGAESLELSTGVSIEVSTSNFRAIRGRTLLAAIFDEAAFFRSESTEAADLEIYRAAVPGLATVNGLLIGITSPWAKRGLVYEKYRKHFGRDDDVLVVKGPTTLFNPTLDPRVIQEALADDPESSKTEWLGEFREGISSFVDRDVIESCVRQRPLIIPPQRGARYVAFTDPAGGGDGPNADQFTLSIAAQDGDRAVVCGVWGRRGSPAEIVREYAEILQAYGIREVFSDRYAGRFPHDEFARHDIKLKYTEHNRSQLYGEVLPLFNTSRIEIPNDPALIGQFCMLERRVGRLTDIIDHPAGQHDDLCNAVAGAAVHAIASKQRITQPIPVKFTI